MRKHVVSLERMRKDVQLCIYMQMMVKENEEERMCVVERERNSGDERVAYCL